MTKNTNKNPVLIKRQSNALLAVMIIALLVGSVLGFLQYQEYSATQQAYSEAESKLADLKIKSTSANNDYNKARGEFQSQVQNFNGTLQLILPKTEQYTKFVQDLDSYFLANAKSVNPIFLSDVRFSAPESSDKTDYAVLPISMTIEGTQQAVKDFLLYVEHTGDINAPNRLIDIKSINLNFSNPDEEGKENPKLNVSLQMNAYFQKTEKSITK